MPLGNLGVCQPDLIQAAQWLKHSQREFCRIVANRPKSCGPPPYIQPPKNATRWQPRGQLALVGNQDGADHLVFSEVLPLGYDGILVSLTNTWNKGGFVEGSGDIVWRVKQDRRYIPFFDTIKTTLGTLTVPFDIVGQGIPLYSGQNLQYFVNFANPGSGALDPLGSTLCALTGYIWPRTDYQWR
jgi:hypothetical protein